jgi:predicted LPLAT superfamily acyltransferase
MSARWTERQEIGNPFFLNLIRDIGLSCGRRATRLLLYPITLYFFFRRGPERRASRLYLQRLLGRPVSVWHVMRHIHCFACTILDRLFLLGERFKRFDIRTSAASTRSACSRWNGPKCRCAFCWTWSKARASRRC